MNQSSDHWLLYDALNSFITWNLKMKENARIQTTFEPLMDDGRIPLSFICWLLIFKKKLLGFLTFFLQSYEVMKKRKFITCSL